VSLHKIVAPTYVQMLGSMDGLLEKAKAHCQSHKLDESVLLQFRLYPNMYSLVRQVQATADHAAGSCLRLAGRDATNPPRDEDSFDALRKRVADALAKVQSVSAAEMDANAERELTLTMGSRELKMKGWDYMVHLAMPNFWFHHTTAYNILRHNGVEVGKRDFLGSVPGFPSA
jgi:uncharacterized protein